MYAIAAVALGLHAAVKLFGQGDAGHHEIHPLRFREDDRHVLEKVLDEEARREIALQHPRYVVHQRPTISPLRPTTNFSKFQLIFPGPTGFVSSAVKVL